MFPNKQILRGYAENCAILCPSANYESSLMTEYTISYARFLLRSWGFTRKVPMGRHVKRASRQKIAWFRKKLGPLIEERMRAGYTVCVQDEAICVADARLRKGIYTPKGVRGVYAYTGSHSKTIVFGLITIDGEGFFQRYGSFTGKEFVEFLKAACERFGKILMITDGAPQHRSKFVREEIGRLDGVELQFLPPGCPDLNAIEEVWRQMKHAILRLDPLLFFKPAHPAFQARFRQTACSASHSNLWFTSPHTMSLMRSYVFSGFRYLSPMIRHVLTLRIACST